MKRFGLFLFFLFVCLFYFQFAINPTPALAGSGDNLSGWAWSDSYGWISFNSTDTSSSYDYGVKVDNVTKRMSGYAWSDNIGWIQFSGTAPDYTFNGAGYGNCPSCTSALSCTACYNATTKKLYGWAQILSMGADGWIRLDDNNGGTAPNYGTLYDPVNNWLTGWAWNNNPSNTGVGWISFNCLNGGPTQNNICGTTNYYVKALLNAPPTISFSSMTSPGYCDAACACGSTGALNPQLKWNFSDPDVGDTQDQYQIVFDSTNRALATLDALTDGSGASLPLKTPVQTGAASSFYPTNNIYRNVAINYNTKYYYWIKVWDNNGGDSGWVQFNAENYEGDANPLNFGTYLHEFPIANFTYNPANPSIDEQVKFDSQTLAKYFTSGSPSTPVSCIDANCDWQWTALSAALPPTTINSPTASTTIIVLHQKTSVETINLNVSDLDGYSCDNPINIKANWKLPQWKESGGR